MFSTRRRRKTTECFVKNCSLITKPEIPIGTKNLPNIFGNDVFVCVFCSERIEEGIEIDFLFTCK